MSGPNKRPANRRVDELKNEAAGKRPILPARISKVSRHTPLRERQKSAITARRSNMQEEDLAEVMASLKVTDCLDRTPASQTMIETVSASEIPMTIDTLVASDETPMCAGTLMQGSEDTPMTEAAEVPLPALEAEETEWLNEMDEVADLLAGWA
ncbi:hypothetical protein HII31_10376 [Pseudocercospora fuligena]|uniref:Uncharacterized protein n=1 Tax=Pseudocercospora fuligena TaxID=685502 RepID=A0A8H6RCX0_9PEZI|nr:hypothetical protein HII31_10376 [Pseudocercospora fuligena]